MVAVLGNKKKLHVMHLYPSRLLFFTSIIGASMVCLLDRVHQIDDADILFPHISSIYRHPPYKDILPTKIFSIHIYHTSAYILLENKSTIYRYYLSTDTLPLQISS
jgi:hypothetical protein